MEPALALRLVSHRQVQIEGAMLPAAAAPLCIPSRVPSNGQFFAVLFVASLPRGGDGRSATTWRSTTWRSLLAAGTGIIRGARP
jgi:hypothetical protein